MKLLNIFRTKRNEFTATGGYVFGKKDLKFDKTIKRYYFEYLVDGRTRQQFIVATDRFRVKIDGKFVNGEIGYTENTTNFPRRYYFTTGVTNSNGSLKTVWMEDIDLFEFKGTLGQVMTNPIGSGYTF